MLLALLLLLLPMSASVGEQVLAGYSPDDGYTYLYFGQYPQTKSDDASPVLWRVLESDGETALLLSEYILESRAVHADKNAYRGWESSDLFRWLNGEFLQTAFSGAEQSVLAALEDGGRVSLLSADEARLDGYGFRENASHEATGTEHAVAGGLDSYSGRVRYSPWWLRDVSADNPQQQRRIIDNGKLGRTGVNSRTTGVRPVIRLLLSGISVGPESGAREDPFTCAVSGDAAAGPVPETLPAETLPPVPEITEAPQPEATGVPELPETPQPADPPADGGRAADAGARVIADRDTASPLFPALAENGFLPEGETEFVYSDEENGLWLYASQTLRIEIHRRAETSPKKLRWYEAEIYCQPESDMFSTYAYDETKYKNYNRLANPQDIAKQHHLVFAMNTDFFIYRVGRQKEVSYTYPIGIVIRKGVLMYDVPKKANSTVYPPLDVAALYPDGDVRLFLNGETTGDALLADGAQDVLSFGPLLVQDGAVSPRASAFGDVDNPRTAFGMVEKGHYFCVLLEGRLEKTYSAGGSCMWMADTMYRLGCRSAINLDGGQTACMIFMGSRINMIGTYSGSATNKDRGQNELLGIGISPQVGQ